MQIPYLILHKHKFHKSQKKKLELHKPYKFIFTLGLISSKFVFISFIYPIECLFNYTYTTVFTSFILIHSFPGLHYVTDSTNLVHGILL